MANEKILLGISDCLLGHKVRFDGGHKHDPYITKVLGDYFDYRPFCPELASGMSVPRETIRLLAPDTKHPENYEVVASDNPARRYTEQLKEASSYAKNLQDDLCGYILMKGSPSCGMDRVKVYGPNGYALHHKGVGVFAERLQAENPWLPIEENGRLHDPMLRENFLTRVFALYDFKQRVLSAQKYQQVIDFYSEYKYLVMSHSIEAYKAIGRYLAVSSKLPLRQVQQEFGDLFFGALKKRANKGSHTNVLMHLRGYIKSHLSASSKKQLSDVIDHYRKGSLPLSVPVMLLRQLNTNVDNNYLNKQRYWEPCPDALGLRNYT